MRKRIFEAAALAAGLAFGGCALANDDAQTADVRCLVVTLKALNVMKTEEMKSSGAVAVMYFVGKLDGREKGFDLQNAIVSEIDKMKSEDLGKEGQRCGAELQTRGQTMQEIGEDLTKKGY
jgi:hypothetical protein